MRISRLVDGVVFVGMFVLFPVLVYWLHSMDFTLEFLRKVYLRFAMAGIFYFVVKSYWAGGSRPSLFYRFARTCCKDPQCLDDTNTLYRMILAGLVSVLGIAAIYDILFIIMQ